MKRKGRDEFVARLRELEAAGYPNISRTRLSLDIHVTDEPILRVRNLGVTSYVIPVLLRNGPQKLCVERLDLKLAWEDPLFHFLEQDDGDYQFYGPYQKYARDEVLDVSHDPVLQPKEEKSFLVLAGSGLIPSFYEDKTLIEAKLVIYDQFGAAHSRVLKLRLDRSHETQISRVRPGRGLYAAEEIGNAPAKTPVVESKNRGAGTPLQAREEPPETRRLKTLIN